MQLNDYEGYLTIIPRTRIVYELLDRGRGEEHQVHTYIIIHHFSGAPRGAFQQPVYNKCKVRWLRVLARPLQAVQVGYHKLKSNKRE